jgi:hypothetical protein
MWFVRPIFRWENTQMAVRMRVPASKPNTGFHPRHHPCLFVKLLLWHGATWLAPKKSTGSHITHISHISESSVSWFYVIAPHLR